MQEELVQIYMMGFDVWSEGQSEDEYLDGCRNSVKYKKGVWYVLTDDHDLLSSLIVYKLDPNQIGIGSIATASKYRNQGYASELINLLLSKLDKEYKNHTYFLYSDISYEFYSKFGFSKLEQPLQRYNDSICMVRSLGKEPILSYEQVPKYF